MGLCRRTSKQGLVRPDFVRNRLCWIKPGLAQMATAGHKEVDEGATMLTEGQQEKKTP